jgi:hypothetical protein
MAISMNVMFTYLNQKALLVKHVQLARSMARWHDYKKCLFHFWSGGRSRSTSAPQLNLVTRGGRGEASRRSCVYTRKQFASLGATTLSFRGPCVLPDPPQMHTFKRPKQIFWPCIALRGEFFSAAISHAWRKLTAFAVVQWESAK